MVDFFTFSVTVPYLTLKGGLVYGIMGFLFMTARVAHLIIKGKRYYKEEVGVYRVLVLLCAIILWPLLLVFLYKEMMNV